MMRSSAILCFLSTALLGQPQSVDPLLQWMNRIAQQQMDARDKAIAAIKSAPEADRRKQQVRSRILNSIGGLPSYDGPLNARRTGVLANASYTIEKVVFESLPGFLVTANVYRPNAPGRYPAVLLSAGHTTLGKTENHRMGANLATKGFVALAYDPVGLGERIQAVDPKTRKHAGGCCANEHLQAGAQALLIGKSVARYFIWDAKRAIDYLVSRPDVDADRIGAAGCSGGGCVTTYIAALDPRVKAAAPACYLNSLRLLFTGPTPDSEMSLPNLLANGLDHADFVELAAPSPWLILATEGDFFTPPAVRMVYEEARRWYRMYGAEDRLAMFMGAGPHGTPLETREALYAWMIRWLKDRKGDAREGDIPLYKDEELQVTASGQVENEPGSRKLYDLIRTEYQAARNPQPIAQFAKQLDALGVRTNREPPLTRLLEQFGTTGTPRRRISFESEPGVTLTANLYQPPGTGRHPALLVVAGAGTPALAERAAAAGYVVLELEVRDTPSSNDKRPYLGNWLVNLRADLIGRSLPAMRARDILRGIDLLSSLREVDTAAIRAAARDVKGVWLLLAAAVDARIGGIWLDRTPYSLSAAMDHALNANLFDATIRGFLLHGDLPDLVLAMAPRRVIWTDPTDWVGATVTLSAAPYFYRAPSSSDSQIIKDLFR